MQNDNVLRSLLHLKDAPDILCGVAELAACNAGTEVEVAYADAVVFDSVCKVIVALCHSTDEDCNALVLVETSNVVAEAYNLGVETESHFAAVGWQMIGDGVLDHLNQLLLRRCRSNLMPVEQLHHQTSKALEGSRDAHCGADPDEDVTCSLDVDLELARLIDRRIEKSEQTLYRHVSAVPSLQLPQPPDLPGG